MSNYIRLACLTLASGTFLIVCVTKTSEIEMSNSHVSVSVHILANNALRAHHASAHGGLSANVLSYICLSFF